MAQKPSKEVLDLVAKVETTLKERGTFQPIDIEARELEAFEQVGGKVLKRYMSGDDKMSAEVSFFVDQTGEATCLINYPISRPMQKQVAEKFAANFLHVASSLVPGNLNLSEFRRLTLTYHNRLPIGRGDDLAKRISWTVNEGASIATSLRAEVTKTKEVPAFSAKDDRIWQSQMGKPVKLSAEELAIVQAAHSGAQGMVVPIAAYVAIVGATLAVGYVYNRATEDPPAAKGTAMLNPMTATDTMLA